MDYMKFAVIQTGGKQYKVSKDDLLSIEKITPARDASSKADAGGGEYKVGDKISF